MVNYWWVLYISPTSRIIYNPKVHEEVDYPNLNPAQTPLVCVSWNEFPWIIEFSFILLICIVYRIRTCCCAQETNVSCIKHKRFQHNGIVHQLSWVFLTYEGTVQLQFNMWLLLKSKWWFAKLTNTLHLQWNTKNWLNLNNQSFFLNFIETKPNQPTKPIPSHEHEHQQLGVLRPGGYAAHPSAMALITHRPQHWEGVETTRLWMQML